MSAPRRRATLREGGHVLPRVTDEARRAYAARDWLGLHRALGLKAWEASPLDEQCVHPDRTAYSESWERSRALREALR